MILQQNPASNNQTNENPNVAAISFMLHDQIISRVFGILTNPLEIDTISFFPDYAGEYLLELEDKNHCLLVGIKDAANNLINISKEQTDKGWLLTIPITVLSNYFIDISYNPEFVFQTQEYYLKLEKAAVNTNPIIFKGDVVNQQLCQTLLFKQQVGGIAFGKLTKISDMAYFHFKVTSMSQAVPISTQSYTISIQDEAHSLIPALLDLNQIAIEQNWEQTLTGWEAQIDFALHDYAYLKIAYNPQLPFAATDYVVNLTANEGDFPRLQKIMASTEGTEHLMLVTLNSLRESVLNFKLKYDPSKLELLNLNAQEEKISLIPGVIGNSGLEATACNLSSGEIDFRFSKDLTEDTEWTGNLTVLHFKSLGDGNTGLSITKLDM